MHRSIGPIAAVLGLTLALSPCTDPYDPGQRAVGGGLLGAGAGAAIGGVAGGGRGAAAGALSVAGSARSVGPLRHHSVRRRLITRHRRRAITSRRHLATAVTPVTNSGLRRNNCIG